MSGSVESVTGKRCCTQSSMAMLPQEFQVKTAAPPGVTIWTAASRTSTEETSAPSR